MCNPNTIIGYMLNVQNTTSLHHLGQYGQLAPDTQALHYDLVYVADGRDGTGSGA